MRKIEIAEWIHRKTGLSIAEATTLLEKILELIKKTLEAGDAIYISGFGKFIVRKKRARPGRNVKTEEAIEISARRVVTFHVSRKFKRQSPGMMHLLEFKKVPNVIYIHFVGWPLIER